MPRIRDIVGTWLAEVTEARVCADRLSATLCEQYDSDPILKFFPVPRVDIAELRVEMKFLVESAAAREMDIIVDSKTLEHAHPETLSTATFVLKVSGCRWTRAEGDRILVVDE